MSWRPSVVAAEPLYPHANQTRNWSRPVGCEMSTRGAVRAHLRASLAAPASERPCRTCKTGYCMYPLRMHNGVCQWRLAPIYQFTVFIHILSTIDCLAIQAASNAVNTYPSAANVLALHCLREVPSKFDRPANLKRC